MNLLLIEYLRTICKACSITIFGLIIISCSSETKNQVETNNNGLKLIDEFNIIFPHLKLDESWTPIIEPLPNQDYFIQMEKDDSLALFNNIWLVKNNIQSDGISDVITEVCYSVPNIFYYWFDGNEGKLVEYNDRLDTLWEYKHIGELKDRNQEVFIRGKYQYMYSNNLLTLEQRKYFEAHRDSLRKLEGNDLPSLPDYYD